MEQVWDAATYADKVGAFEWVPLDMAQVVQDADAASNAVHATEFGRPEDVQIIKNVLYVANTTEDRVIAINLSTNELTGFVQSGVNLPVENEAAEVTGFNSPDNLAAGPTGELWIVEDNDPQRHLGRQQEDQRWCRGQGRAVRLTARSRRGGNRDLLRQGSPHPLREHPAPRKAARRRHLGDHLQPRRMASDSSDYTKEQAAVPWVAAYPVSGRPATRGTSRLLPLPPPHRIVQDRANGASIGPLVVGDEDHSAQPGQLAHPP